MTQRDNPYAPPESHQSPARTRQSSQPTNIRWLIVAMLMGFTILGHFNRVSITVAAKAKFIGPGLLTEVQMG
ncbi:MAG: hypothetical protein WKF77_20675, partial [Planctomycetaceae bacterium]